MTAEVYDAIVVGAGLLGAAAGFELARSGARTLILERGAANRESSGTTAGNLHIQAIHPRRPDQRVAADNRRLLPLQRAASRLWARVEDDLDADVELRRTGGVMIAETEDEVAELRAKRAAERDAGLRTELLDGGAARTGFGLGPTVRAAVWCAEDGFANPLKATPAYLAAASRHGARTRLFAPVTGIARERDAWRVSTRGGTYAAPVVVDAAGPWLGEVAAMAGVDLDVRPLALQMHATVRTRPRLRVLVQHIGQGLSVKQAVAGNVLVGGGWPAPLDLAARSGIDPASIAGNLGVAARVLPFLHELRLLRCWSGPLATTPDEMPVVGEVGRRPGLIVLGGTYGFTLAPLWGRIAAQLARGDAPEVEIGDLTPDRLCRPVEEAAVRGGDGGR